MDDKKQGFEKYQNKVESFTHKLMDDAEDLGYKALDGMEDLGHKAVAASEIVGEKAVEGAKNLKKGTENIIDKTMQGIEKMRK